jgi:Outer membrane protein beta-barrel domain
MKKNILFTGIIALSSLPIVAQKLPKLDFGLQISPGSTFANISDDDATPSSKNLESDGFTSIEENGLKASGLKLIVNYTLNDRLDFSSGLYFSGRAMNVKNEDGSYVGTSNYHVGYTHIPILLKYKSEEIKNNLIIVASFGPTLDFRRFEDPNGADYAHYFNFADNRVDLDPQRGRNGNNRQTNLFASTGLSIYASAGAEYKINDLFTAYAGLSYFYKLNNMLNSNLTYNNKEKTPITDMMKWRANILAFDFGVGIKI